MHFAVIFAAMKIEKVLHFSVVALLSALLFLQGNKAFAEKYFFTADEIQGVTVVDFSQNHLQEENSDANNDETLPPLNDTNNEEENKTNTDDDFFSLNKISNELISNNVTKGIIADIFGKNLFVSEILSPPPQA